MRNVSALAPQLDPANLDRRLFLLFTLAAVFCRCCLYVATRPAPFGSDMHQIVCWPGLSPRPNWGSLQRSPNSLVGIGGGAPRKGKEGGGERWEGSGGKGKGGEGILECPNPELAIVSVGRPKRRPTLTTCVTRRSRGR